MRETDKTLDRLTTSLYKRGMKPKNKFARIHNQPRHGLSKKFMKNVTRLIVDIIGQLRPIGYSSCLERNPNYKSFGKMKGLTWWVMNGKLVEDKKGVKRPMYVRAIQRLLEDRIGREITSDEFIYKRCKTKGCMNINHYEVQKKIMISREQARIFYEAAIKNGEARLPLGDTEEAKKYRLCFYPHKTYFKKNDRKFWEEMDNFELVIRDGDVVCQKKGGDPVLLQAWARANLPTTSSTAERDKGIETAMEALQEARNSGIKPKDESNEVIKKLMGMEEVTVLDATEKPLTGQTCFDYESCQGKASAFTFANGPALTKLEEDILSAGPPIERRE